jgi:plasmid stabilization system protein ParE
MNYHFEVHARQELRDALAYYDSVDPLLGNKFRDEVERLISLLLKFPYAWPELSLSTRRCRTKRFPYSLIYRVREEEVEIVAVMHLSREPNYWVDRM